MAGYIPPHPCPTLKWEGSPYTRFVNGQWSTVNGQRSTVNGQWSTVNGRWSMANQRSELLNTLVVDVEGFDLFKKLECLFRIAHTVVTEG